MKKLWSEAHARLLTRIRQKSALDHQRRTARRKRRGNRLSGGEAARRELQRNIARARHLKLRPIELVAPENFSLVNNTDEMLEFLDGIEDALQQQFQPNLDMRRIKSLGPDAIMVLNATLSKLAHKYQVEISGLEPSIPALAQTLRRSGFYQHVSPPRGSAYIAADRGVIHDEDREIVDAPLLEKLVHFATKALYGQPRDHQPTYAALGEFMHNTFDHASRKKLGLEKWWAAVYHDDAANTVHFTFVDNGVGILGSRLVGFLAQFRSSSGLESDHDLLKSIFEGKLASRTGVPWRGLGLPRIYRRVQAGQLAEMTVITNRVKGRLDSGIFTQLSREFKGTFYHWEMRP